MRCLPGEEDDTYIKREVINGEVVGCVHGSSFSFSFFWYNGVPVSDRLECVCVVGIRGGGSKKVQPVNHNKQGLKLNSFILKERKEVQKRVTKRLGLKPKYLKTI